MVEGGIAAPEQAATEPAARSMVSPTMLLVAVVRVVIQLQPATVVVRVAAMQVVVARATEAAAAVTVVPTVAVAVVVETTTVDPEQVHKACQ